MKKILILLIFVFTSCSNNYTNDYQSCYIDFTYGFDFSNGIPDSIYPSNNDIIVQNWYPYEPVDTTYPSHDGYLWFKKSDNTNLRIADLGIVESDTFNDFTNVSYDLPIPIIESEHMYFIELKDGYVKLIINSISPSTWEIWGDYIFSESKIFQ